MRVLIAKKSHGKCDICKNQINKGDKYIKFLRHATEEEIRSLKIITFSPFRGKGRFRELKRHESCNEKAMMS